MNINRERCKNISNKNILRSLFLSTLLLTSSFASEVEVWNGERVSKAMRESLEGGEYDPSKVEPAIKSTEITWAEKFIRFAIELCLKSLEKSAEEQAKALENASKIFEGMIKTSAPEVKPYVPVPFDGKKLEPKTFNLKKPTFVKKEEKQSKFEKVVPETHEIKVEEPTTSVEESKEPNPNNEDLLGMDLDNEIKVEPQETGLEDLNLDSSVKNPVNSEIKVEEFDKEENNEFVENLEKFEIEAKKPQKQTEVKPTTVEYHAKKTKSKILEHKEKTLVKSPSTYVVMAEAFGMNKIAELNQLDSAEYLDKLRNKANGVNEVTSISSEGEDIYTFTSNLDKMSAIEVAQCISKNISIKESQKESHSAHGLRMRIKNATNDGKDTETIDKVTIILDSTASGKKFGIEKTSGALFGIFPNPQSYDETYGKNSRERSASKQKNKSSINGY